MHIRQVRYAQDPRPVDESCACWVCQRYSRAYLRHLFVAGEILGRTLNSYHNLFFYLDTMRRMRQAILASEFPRFLLEIHSWSQGDIP